MVGESKVIPNGYQELTTSAAWIDLSDRGRLCLVGADRQRFLNGQVTNNVKDLKTGQGCYGALVTAKGKMVCDLNVFILQDEILLDFEPGLTTKVMERLEKYIIADDVQIVDASSSFGLISILGPQAASQSRYAGPEALFSIQSDGANYVALNKRFGLPCVDLFFPRENPPKLSLPRGSMDACEMIRVEQGVPRFGIDMNEDTLVSEALDERAVSYSKGCYIGQEVIARIRTYGQVAKALRGLQFSAGAAVPKSGDKVFHDGKEVGWITSAVFSPKLQRAIALGYVRKECNQLGNQLLVNSAPAEIVATPFAP